MEALLQPVSTLRGVGPTMVKRLAYLDIHTVGELISYYPRQHEDLSEVISMSEVQEGVKVTIRGSVEHMSTRRTWRRKMNMTEGSVTDETGSLRVVWFNQPYVAKSLKIDDEVQLSGVVKRSKFGFIMQNPVYEKVYANKETTHTGRIVPLYPLTAGITQKQIRHFIKLALDRVLPIEEYLPPPLRTQYELLTISNALQAIHFPGEQEGYHKAHERLEFDELLFNQLTGQLVRQDLRTQPAPPLSFHEKKIKQFVASLPFTLTNAQKKAAWKIIQDMEESHPMNRLLVGDVGSGKTVVAAIAMYNTVLNGYQAALMVPTEILAQQHHRSLQKLFAEADIQIELITSQTRKLLKKQQKKLIGEEPQILVGTHALIQEYVAFDRLGLVIIDEQHRFGVRQRKTLKEKSADHRTMPHLLSMTATPIPRTLALALFSDLDLTTINELPPGRKPVRTHLVPPPKREDAYGFIREHVQKGEQVFVICPLIEPSDTLGVKSVTEEYARLSTEVFADLRIGLLHGKMKSEEKDAMMQQMKEKQIDILVSTSVIEVGVDIPNATIMVIEGAQRFGLAQLHQFRGRVGRGNVQSYCLLFTDIASKPVIDRLNAFAKNNNGFELAEIDLKTRGAGAIYGVQQSGFLQQSMINFEHPERITRAQEAAKKTIQEEWLSTYPLLRKKLMSYMHEVHLE